MDGASSEHLRFQLTIGTAEKNLPVESLDSE
jgi:hypothetical protein